MRTVRRGTAIPPTLLANGPGYAKALDHSTTKESDPHANLSFPDHWNRPDVRGLLYAIQGRACAYCGCLLPRNDRGDVEHFRPKGQVHGNESHGGYWWLAYSYHNYLLSCSVCNRTHKRTKFPLRRSNAKHYSYSKRNQINSEARLLLDPTLDDVDTLFDVAWQDELCLLKPLSGLSRTQHKQVQGCIDFFRLNRDVRLINERRTIRNEATNALAANEDAKLRKMAVRYNKHSLVVKRMLEALKPTLLPSAEEELNWLMQDLLEDLNLILVLLQDAEDPRLENKANELLWSMAALFFDPPTGTTEAIQAQLEEDGILPLVLQRVQLL